MTKELKIHMIGNAHLDPVWLWHWQRGSDEALATCRAACDLLDDYPEVIFTRGEAWVHEEVRLIDPVLFERIKKHLKNGRWSVANGWWVQPDLNLPTEEALRKNIQIGHDWFKRHCGLESIPVAYNVDSFGHGAYLPRLLRENGQKYYVMMRPEPHEKELPNLFKWRSPDGSEVLTWRVFGGYLKNNVKFMEKTIGELIDSYQGKLCDVMCFYGVGDHGGGPTRQQVEWILQHKEYAPGVSLEFSSPERFFTSLNKGDIERAPVIEDELQMHAIGCYSVCGGLKRELREAEIHCAETEKLNSHLKTPDPAIDKKIAKAWERICFNQFHDILPGSSVKSAVKTAEHQMGEAIALLDEGTHLLLRKYSNFREKCHIDGHRVNIVNRLDRTWYGFVEGEIWSDWKPWTHHLEDENGTVIPCQLIAPESIIIENSQEGIPKLIFPLKLDPFEHKSFRIVEGEVPPPAEIVASQPCFKDGVLFNNLISVEFNKQGIAGVTRLFDNFQVLQAPLSWDCRKDPSDTWGHGLKSFDSPIIHTAVFVAEPIVIEEGLFVTTVRLDGWLNDASVSLFVTLHNDDSTLKVALLTNYREPMSVLKANIAPSGGLDGISHLVAGGWIERELDGLEKPFHHAILSEGPQGKIGLVVPDAFAVDATPDSIHPTMVRNNLYALHKSQGAGDLLESAFFKGRMGTDEGPLLLRLALACDQKTSKNDLQSIIDQYFSPPHFWDDYRDGQRLSNIKEVWS